MNLQGMTNQTIGTVAQSVAVGKMLGGNAAEGLEAQNNLNAAKDALEDNSIKQAQLPKMTRTDRGRYLDALDAIQEERQTLLDQKNDLIAYYQGLYHGVSEEGKVDLHSFRPRVIPKKVSPKHETVPTAEEVIDEQQK